MANQEINKGYIKECEERRKIVSSALAVVTTATKGPNEAFMNALNAFIYGKISMEELRARTDRKEFLEV